MRDVVSMMWGARLTEAERQRALAVRAVLADWADMPTGVVVHEVTKRHLGYNFEVHVPRPTTSLCLSIIAGTVPHEYAEILPLNANGPVYTTADAETNDETPHKVKAVATVDALRAEIVRLAGLARENSI